MGYRDENEAALQRVQNLEQRLADEQAENKRLAGLITKANAEIIRLHGQPIAPVVAASPQNNRALLFLLGVAVAGLVVLGMAAYRSERGGVQAALFVIPLWGALFGAWVQRRRTLGGLVIGAVAGAVIAFLTLSLFFATLWRAL